jgi:hypothetical protein
MILTVDKSSTTGSKGKGCTTEYQIRTNRSIVRPDPSVQQQRQQQQGSQLQPATQQPARQQPATQQPTTTTARIRIRHLLHGKSFESSRVTPMG